MEKKITIGIVDDDDIYRYTIRKTIESLQLSKEILIFTDGEEAIQFITGNIENTDVLPDVILLDVNMPLMDGFEFMEEYQKIKTQLGKKITIFMISSSVNPVDVNRAKSIPDISDYIVKPIKQGKLMKIISDLSEKGLL